MSLKYRDKSLYFVTKNCELYISLKKKVQEKKLHRNDLMFKAYRAAYWLVKEKV